MVFSFLQETGPTKACFLLFKTVDNSLDRIKQMYIMNSNDGEKKKTFT